MHFFLDGQTALRSDIAFCHRDIIIKASWQCGTEGHLAIFSLSRSITGYVYTASPKYSIYKHSEQLSLAV